MLSGRSLLFNLLKGKNHGVFQKLKTIRYFSASVISHSLTSPTTSVQQQVEHIKQNLFENNYGQPTPKTHPHILQKNEITEGISKSEYQSRRKKLMKIICKHSCDAKIQFRNHVVVIPAATKKYMSGQIPYTFRQNSDFLYLTGCLEPGSILVLTINYREIIKAILFVPPKNRHAELWDGPRTGVKNAVEFFGVDEAYDINLFEKVFPELFSEVNGPSIVWYDHEISDLSKVTDVVMQSSKDINSINSIESPTIFIHKLRVIKSPAEINLMRKSCEITSESINEVIAETKPNDSEHHVFARIDYKCRMRNATRLAYPPVVAAGRNATIIHYINNTQLIKNYDLILMDAGCEYGCYTSDITRTWPVNGQFREPQKILYEIILNVQKDLFETVLKNGGRTLDELFDTMCLKLGKYLREAGLLPNDLSQIELARAAYSFCPHHVSHYLGMDVHDTPLISRSTPLTPGMVFTIEPGVYIGLDRIEVPPEFRGIGIRVEDDVLVKSDNTIEVLSKNCCKDVESLQNLILKNK